MMALSKFYSIDQVAESLGVSRETIRLLLKAGEIKGVKVGAIWRINEEEINRYLNR
jgi:excisionase family DNA binding protein